MLRVTLIVTIDMAVEEGDEERGGRGEKEVVAGKRQAVSRPATVLKREMSHQITVCHCGRDTLAEALTLPYAPAHAEFDLEVTMDI